MPRLPAVWALTWETVRRWRQQCLGFQMLLWCAVERHPTDIAAVLFCSRSSVYGTAWAYQAGTLGLEPDDQGWLMPPMRTPVLFPTLHRSLWALRKATPRPMASVARAGAVPAGLWRGGSRHEPSSNICRTVASTSPAL